MSFSSFLKTSFTQYQWWKNYELVWLMEWLIAWFFIILFLVLSPFPFLLDTFLELKDCVKVPSLLSYHVCAHLLGEFFYLGSDVFHEEITLPPYHENDCWFVESVYVEEHGMRCSDVVCAYCISIDTQVLLAYFFTALLSAFISSADVTSFRSPFTYTVFIEV